MEIVNADLFTPTEEQLDMGANIVFKVEFDNGDKADVPADPVNRHYWEVREWYFKQPKKPFDFDFEQLTKAES